MITKREDLKNKKYKTNKERIELNITCKIIKRELKIFNAKRMNTKINKILQTMKSIKAIKKLNSPGKMWCSYVLNNKKEKIYGRKDINKVVTDYYGTLYQGEKDCPHLKITSRIWAGNFNRRSRSNC